MTVYNTSQGPTHVGGTPHPQEHGRGHIFNAEMAGKEEQDVDVDADTPKAIKSVSFTTTPQSSNALLDDE